MDKSRNILYKSEIILTYVSRVSFFLLNNEKCI